MNKTAECHIPVHHHGKVIRLPSSLLVFRNYVVPTLRTLYGKLIAAWDATAQEWRCESNGAWSWCERNGEPDSEGTMIPSKVRA